MASVPTRVYGPAQPTAAGGTVYTVPTQKRLIITSILICNTAAQEKWCRIGIGGLAASNLITSDARIPTGKTEILAPAIPISATETIAAQAETDASVTVTISGLLEDV